MDLSEKIRPSFAFVTSKPKWMNGLDNIPYDTKESLSQVAHHTNDLIISMLNGDNNYQVILAYYEKRNYTALLGWLCFFFVLYKFLITAKQANENAKLASLVYYNYEKGV